MNITRQYASSRYSLPSGLETRGNTSRSQAALAYLKVDGLRVQYVGPGQEDKEAATIRTNFPAPADCPLYYFEVHIISKGALGYIGVGYTAEDVLLSRLPGWDPGSYGYHGDDGFAFNGNGQGRSYGPMYGTGDTIGALLCRVDKTIRFFKNGVDLGVAFQNVAVDKLYPCVGFRSRGEEGQLNLGRSGDPPFVADLQSVVNACKEQVLAQVHKVSLPLAAPCGSPLLPKLLYDYMLHARCWKTAAILQKELTQEPAQPVNQPTDSVMATSSEQRDVSMTPAHPSDTEGGAAVADAPTAAGGGGQAGAGRTEPAGARQVDVPMEPVGDACTSGQEDGEGKQTKQVDPSVAVRQESFQCISSGQILEAKRLLDKFLAPATWATHHELEFKIKIAHFCELITGDASMSSWETAIEYGRTALATHTPRTEANDELMKDALTLLAYPDKPESSPCGYLLSPGFRSNLAEQVDQVIRDACGLPATSTLETLARQALTTVDTLRQQNCPQAFMLDARSTIFG